MLTGPNVANDIKIRELVILLGMIRHKHALLVLTFWNVSNEQRTRMRRSLSCPSWSA
jgi:hypothetical protein